MDYEVGLLECAARNNPQASRSVQKLPLLIITTIFPAVHVGFHPTVGFYPTANFIQLWISRYQHYFFDCHKDIALALQLIHNKKCRLNTGSIFIMQQDNRIFPRFGQDSLFNIGAALTAPVQGIDRPQHREHIQLLFEAFVPASIGRTDKNGFRSCYLLQYLIRGDQLLSKGFPVIACQLNMTIGVVADQMSLLLHTQNQLRIFFCILPCNKKTGFCTPLCQAVQKYFRIDRMRTVIC